MPNANAFGIVKQYRPGDDIDTRCGKCKEERVHAILAVSPKGEIERVQCRTCYGSHIFRDAKKVATAKRATSSSSSKKSEPVVPTGPARAYSMQQRYQIGDQISHPTFGTGLVVETRQSKIDVRFGREVKTLIHAG